MAVLLLAPAASASAADPAVSPLAEPHTVEEIQTRLRQLSEANDLDESTRGKAQALYQQTLEQLEAAARWTSELRRYEQLAASAADDLAGAKADQDRLAQKQPIAEPRGSLAELERALAEKELELAEVKAQLLESETELKRRSGRRTELPKLLADARQRLAELEKTPVVTTADETPHLTTARQMLAAAERLALGKAILVYEQEPKTYDARAELLPLQCDVAKAKLAQVEQAVARWRDVVNQRRQFETEAQLRRAKRETTQALPGMAALVERNEKLAERRQELAGLIADVEGQLERTRRTLADLKDQFTRTRQKIEAVGETDSIGLLLRRHRDALPEVSIYRQNIAKRQEVIRKIRLELFELDEHRARLADLDAQIQTELDELQGTSDDARRDEFAGAIRDVLITQREYLVALMADANTYLDRLFDLDTDEELLIKEIKEMV